MDNKTLAHTIARVLADKDLGDDFFDAMVDEFGQGYGDLQHVKLDNGKDAIVSLWADAVVIFKDKPYIWDMELVQTLASAFLMKVVVLKKYDCETNWSITEDFEDIDDSKGLDLMGYFKGVEDATVLDTVDDVERAYDEYTDNLKEQYASDQETLNEELTKAQKGKDEIIEQVKHKNPSDFVMICNDDADSCEVVHKFSTILQDGFNQVSYTIGLMFDEEE